MHNPDKLSILIRKAQGNLTLNNFAATCGINAGNLSRILNKKNLKPPKPDTLKKIATNSQNDSVTYYKLMIAAGHIECKEENLDIDSYFDKVKNINIEDNQDVDIANLLLSIKNTLENDTNLLFYGNNLSEETRNSLIGAISYGLNVAMVLNKK